MRQTKHLLAFALLSAVVNPTFSSAQERSVSASLHPFVVLKDKKTASADLLIYASQLRSQIATGSPTAKTTAVQSRLIAKSSRSWSGGVLGLTDSTRYVYSGDRGGDLVSEIKCDFMITYDVSGSAATPYSRTFTSFNTANKRVSDTTDLYNTSSSSFDYFSRNTYTYNTSGYMTGQLQETWSGSLWMFSFWDKMTYNTSGLQLTDTVMNSVTPGDYNYVIVNTYDTKGNILTSTQRNYLLGAWTDFSMTTYTYNASGAIATYTTQYNTSGTGLVNSTRAAYTYDASGKLSYVTSDVWSTSSAAWKPNQVIVHRYDASGFLSRLTAALWDNTASAYDSIARLDMTGNVHGQTTSETSYSYGGGSWVVDDGDFVNRYYYEDYTTAIQEAQLPQAQLNVFPVPSATQLNVQIVQHDARALDLYIVDMQGRTLQSHHYGAAKNISDQLSVAHLPAGNYLMRLSDGTVRSFVVAH